MITVTIDVLKKQLAESEQELEATKAAIYRIDGAITLLRHIIKEAEQVSAETQ